MDTNIESRVIVITERLRMEAMDNSCGYE